MIAPSTTTATCPRCERPVTFELRIENARGRMVVVINASAAIADHVEEFHTDRCIPPESPQPGSEGSR